jgi:hypothetical protein
MAASAQGQTLSKYVTLISSDGFEFVVLREAACISGAIKRMLDPTSTYLTPVPASPHALSNGTLLIIRNPDGFAESISGRCAFEEIKYVAFHFLPSMATRTAKKRYWVRRIGQAPAVDDYIKNIANRPSFSLSESKQRR